MGNTHLIRIYGKTKANLAEAKRKHIIKEEKHVTYDGFVQTLLDAWEGDHAFVEALKLKLVVLMDKTIIDINQDPNAYYKVETIINFCLDFYRSRV